MYNIGIGAHDRYASDQQAVSEFRKQYHMPVSDTNFMSGQTKVLDLVPKHPAVSLLMQTYRKKTWARFRVPHDFHSQRFASRYIAPSLGPPEKQDADIRRINAAIKDNPDDTSGEILNGMLSQVKETNEMIDYVQSRMKQFIQG